jgi:hypothetical protein
MRRSSGLPVIVASELRSVNLIASREDYDRNVFRLCVRFWLPTDIPAVDIRQDQIEHNQVWSGATRLVVALNTIRGGCGVESSPRPHVRTQFRLIPNVLNDQNPMAFSANEAST